MTFDAGVNVWWLLWMRHDTDTDIQRAPAGHKNRQGDKGGRWQPDKRHNYDREPGTGSGSSRDNRLELQRGNSIIGIVLPKCPGPQCLACVCDHDWFGNIYNQKTWLIASCPAPTTTPTLPLNFESHHTHGWLATWAGDSSWLNLKILTIFQRENECKEAKVPNGPMELF